MTSATLRLRMATCVFSITLVVLLFSLPLLAQANFGRILGTVSDPTGAVLPGTKVSLLDTQRGLARTVTTDEAGQHSAPTLIPGAYTRRADLPGGKTLGRQYNLVAVGRGVRGLFAIQPRAPN